jgi:hypothetical protein
MGWHSVRRRQGLAAAAAALALSVAVAGASLALAAPAGAAPLHLPRVVHLPVPAVTTLSATAPASHGYRLALSGLREEPLRGKRESRSLSYLTLSLQKGSTEAKYAVSRGVAADGTIMASLGSLGRLAVRFVPGQVIERPVVRHCDRRETVERGALRGTIAFHGENGYSDIEVGALPATLTTSPEAHCTFHVPRSRKSSGPHRGVSFGGLRSRGRNGFVDFTAEAHRRLGTATLLASSSEQRGRVSISRYASAVVPARAAPFDRTAGTASVDPSAPFTGSASFRAFSGKESGTWLGTLAVDFPGRPGVHLAGRHYKGSLIGGDECGPDEPGSFCSYAKIRSPIGLGPVRVAEPPAPPKR